MQLEEGISGEFEGPCPDTPESGKFLNFVLVGPFTDKGKIATGFFFIFYVALNYLADSSQ